MYKQLIYLYCDNAEEDTMKSTIKKISVFLLTLTLIITGNQYIGAENATTFEDDYVSVDVNKTYDESTNQETLEFTTKTKAPKSYEVIEVKGMKMPDDKALETQASYKYIVTENGTSTFKVNYSVDGQQKELEFTVETDSITQEQEEPAEEEPDPEEDGTIDSENDSKEVEPKEPIRTDEDDNSTQKVNPSDDNKEDHKNDKETSISDSLDIPTMTPYASPVGNQVTVDGETWWQYKDGSMILLIKNYNPTTGFSLMTNYDARIIADFGTTNQNTGGKEITLELEQGLKFVQYPVKGAATDTAVEIPLTGVNDSQVISSTRLTKAQYYGTYNGKLTYNLANNGVLSTSLNFIIAGDQSLYSSPKDLLSGIKVSLKTASDNLGALDLDASIQSTGRSANFWIFGSVANTGKPVDMLENSDTAVSLGATYFSRNNRAIFGGIYTKSIDYELYLPEGFTHTNATNVPSVCSPDSLDDTKYNCKFTNSFSQEPGSREYLVVNTIGVAAGTYTTKQGIAKATFYDGTTQIMNMPNITVEVADSSVINNKLTITGGSNNHNYISDNFYTIAPTFNITGDTYSVKTDQYLKVTVDDTIDLGAIRLPYSDTNGDISNIRYTTNLGKSGIVPQSAISKITTTQSKAVTIIMANLGMDDNEYVETIEIKMGDLPTGFSVGGLDTNNSSFNIYSKVKSGETSGNVTVETYAKLNDVIDSNTQSSYSRVVSINSNVYRTTMYSAANNLNVTAGTTQKNSFNITSGSYLYANTLATKNPTIYLKSISGVEFTNIKVIQIDTNTNNSVELPIIVEPNVISETTGSTFTKISTEGELGRFFLEAGKLTTKRFVVEFDVKTTNYARGSYVWSDYIFIQLENAINSPQSGSIGNRNNIIKTGDTMTSVNSGPALSIISQEGLYIDTSIKQSNGESQPAYDEDNPDTAVGFTPNSDAIYEVAIQNITTGTISSIDTYIPVPKEGNNFGTNFQSQTFAWNMKLKSTPVIEVFNKNGDNVTTTRANEYKFTYSTDATNDYATATYGASVNLNASMIKVSATNIPEGEYAVIKFVYTIDETAASIEGTDKLGEIVDFRPYFIYNSLSASGSGTGTRVGARLDIGQIEGRIFIDKNFNGIKDGNDEWLTTSLPITITKVGDTTATPIIVNTDADGKFVVPDLEAAKYNIDFNGLTSTTYPYFTFRNENGTGQVGSAAYQTGTNKGMVLNIDPTDINAKSLNVGLLDYKTNDVTITAQNLNLLAPLSGATGTTGTIVPIILPTNFSNKLMDGGYPLYSSADTSIATVESMTGVVTAVSAGSTTVTITVKDIFGNNITKDVTVLVKPNEEPTISFDPDPVLVEKGGTFNALDGVTPYDPHETLTMANVKVINNPVNTSVVGIYTVTYTVEDSDHNIVTGYRKVIVKDDSIVIDGDYIFQRTGFTISKNDVPSSEADRKAQVLSKGNVKIWDMSNDYAPVTPEFTLNGYSNIPAAYTIDINPTGATNKVTLKATVLNGDVVIQDGYALEVGVGFITLTDAKATVATANVPALVKAQAYNAETGAKVSGAYVDGPFTASAAGDYTVTVKFNVPGKSTISKQAKIVVVDDAIIIPGKDFAISANPVSKLEGVYDKDTTSNTTLTGWANVKVYDMNTGLVVSEDVTVISKPNTNTQGNYKLKFAVTNELTTEVEVDFNITSDNPPVIHFPDGDSDVAIINVGTSFNPATGVYATDVEDDAAGKPITVSSTGNVNTNTAGIYVLTYSATDSDNNTTTRKRTIVVDDGTFTVVDNFIFKGVNFVIGKDEVDTTNALTQVKTKTGLKVYKAGSNTEVAYTVNLNGYSATPNTYNIVVNPDEKPAVTHTLKAIVTNGTVVTDGKYALSLSNGFAKLSDAKNYSNNDIINALKPEVYDLETGIKETNPSLSLQTGITINAANKYSPIVIFTKGTTNLSKTGSLTVVDGEVIVDGVDYVLFASDITKLQGQYDKDSTSDATIKEWAKAKAYNKSTGADASVNVTGKPASNDVGNYKVNFAVANELDTKVEMDFEITSNNKPVIQFSEEPAKALVIDKGATFNKGDGVYIFDAEDGDMYKDNAIINNAKVTLPPETINTNNPGVYTLTYKAVDSDLNETIAIRTVIVNDGTYELDGDYIIKGKGFTINKDLVAATDTAKEVQIRTNAGVLGYKLDTATNKFVSETINIDLNGYSSTPNSYKVKLSPASDAGKVKEIIVIVNDGSSNENDKYVIVSKPAIITVDAAKTITPSQIIDVIQAKVYSKTTGEMTSAELTGGNNIIGKGVGTYTVTFRSVADNSLTSTQDIRIIDEQDVINGDKYAISANDVSITVGTLTNQTNIENYLISQAKATAYKILSGTGEVKMTPSTIPSISDDIVGITTIEFYVIEEPATKISIELEIRSNNKPVFDPFTNPLVIQKGSTWTSSMIWNGVTVTDAEDTPAGIPLNLTESGVVDANTAGTYLMTMYAQDSDGNTTPKNRMVVVDDGTLVYDDKYVYQLNGFSIKSEEVMGDLNAQLLSKTNAKAWSISDNTPAPLEVVNSNGYSATPNKYEIVFGVTGDLTHSKKTNAIVVPSDSTITPGSKYVIITSPAYVTEAQAKALNTSGVPALIEAKVYDKITYELNSQGAAFNSGTIPTTPGDNSIVQVRAVAEPTLVGSEKIYVLEGEKVVESDKYVITANNFEYLNKKFSTDNDNTIITAAGAKAYLKSTMSEVGVEIVTKPADTVGTHTIVFGVNGETQPQISVAVTILSNNAPTITFSPEVANINVGTTFNPWTGVTLSDVEDSGRHGMTEAQMKAATIIKIDGIVTQTMNTSVAGVHLVNYSYTDKDTNPVSKTRIVIVNDGSFTEVGDYILQAKPYAIKADNVDTTDPETQVKTLAQVHVWDKDTQQEVAYDLNIDGYTNVEKVYSMTLNPVASPTDQIIFHVVVTNGNVVVIGDYAISSSPVKIGKDEVAGLDQEKILELLQAKLYKLSTGEILTGDLELGSGSQTITETPGDYTQVIQYNGDATVKKTDKVTVSSSGQSETDGVYEIEATGFTLLHNRFNPSDAGFNQMLIDEAQVKAIKLSDGSNVTSDVIVVSTTVVNTVGNNYEVVFGLNASTGSALTITVPVIVRTNEAPVISFTSNPYIVAKDAPFNPMTGVSATDLENGNLTSRVEVKSGTVDNTVEGIYTLVYTVTDDDDNETTKSRTIIVNKDKYDIEGDYIFEGKSFIISQKDVDESDLEGQVISKSGAEVYKFDAATGTTSTVPFDTHMNGYSKTPNGYTISINPSEDLLTTHGFVATVVKDENPNPVNGMYLAANNFTITEKEVASFNINKLVTKADARLIIIETGQIITTGISTTFNLGSLAVGDNYVTIQKTQNGTNVTKEIIITVVEGEIVGEDDEYVIMASPFSILSRKVAALDDEAIKGLAKASGYEKETHAPATVKVHSLSLSDTPGTSHYVELTLVEDPTLIIKVPITVKADTDPYFVFSNPQQVSVGSTYDPKAGVTVKDDEDAPTGNINSKLVIVDNKVNTAVPGVYTVEMSATDNDGNTSIATRTVIVNDGSYVVDGDYILSGKGFVIDRSDVDTSNSQSQIVSKGNVNVWQLNTSTNLYDETPYDLDMDGYTNADKLYVMELSPQSDSSVIHTFNVLVTAGDINTKGDYSIISKPARIGTKQAKGITSNDIIEYTHAKIWDNKAADYVNNAVGVSSSPKVGETPGTYDVQLYFKQDSNLNQIQNIEVVDSDYVSENDNYFLSGNDFSVFEREIVPAGSTLDETFFNLAGIKADKNGTALTYSDITVTTTVTAGTTVPTASLEDTYTVNFAITADPSVNIDVIIKVKSNKDPVYTFTNPLELTLGDDYTAGQGVTVDDREDGNITDDLVVVSNNVNTSVEGIYTVEYSVEDSHGNIVNAEQTVIVNDGHIEVVGDYVILAQSVAMAEADVNTSDLGGQLETLANIKVYDYVTNQDKPYTLNLGSYDGTEGTYVITISVDENLTATKDFNVLITKYPVETNGHVAIESQPATIGLSQAKDITNPEVLAFVQAKAYDLDTNTDISHRLNVVQNVTDTPNEYTVVIGVNGSDLTKDETITVIDKDIVIENDDYLLSLNNFSVYERDIDVIKFVELASAVAIDKATGLEVLVTIGTNPITDATTVPEAVLFEDYTVEYKAGNLSQDITVTVKSNKDPVYTFTNPLELTLNATYVPGQGVTVSDREDGNITDDLEIVSSNVDTSKEGIYTVDYSVEDSYGNIVTATQTVIVDDGHVVIDGDYVIYATNVAIVKDEVNSSNLGGQLETLAEIRVYNYVENKDKAYTLDLGSYDGSLGNYTITISVDADPTVTKDFNVLISEYPVETDGHVAIESQPATIGLSQAKDITDPEVLAFVDAKAYDLDTNTDISANLKVVQDIKAEAAKYTITLGIAGSDFTKEETVTVMDKDIVIEDDEYIIWANDFSVYEREIDVTKFIELAQAGAMDKATNLPEDVTVTINPITDSTTVPDAVLSEEYTVEFSAGTVSVSVKVTVKSNKDPVITIDVDPLVLNVGQAHNVMEGIRVSDREDPNITIDDLKVIENTVDINKPGIYLVKYELTDTHINPNTAYAQRTVIVNDGNFVIENGIAIYAKGFVIAQDDVNTSDLMTQAKTLAKVKVYDVYTLSELPYTLDLGGYTNAEGTYTVKVTADQDPTVSKEATVEVTYEEIIQDDEFGISAENITLGVKQVPELNDTKLMALANTKVINITTMQQVPNGAVVVDNTIKAEAGIYDVTFAVNGHEEVRTTIKVTVREEEVVIEDREVAIAANSFTIRLNQVADLTPNQFIELARAHAWDRKTNQPLDVNVVDTNVESKVGTYQVTFAVNSKPTVKVSIDIKVIRDTTYHIEGNDAVIYYNELVKAKKEGNLESLIIERTKSHAWSNDEINGIKDLPVYILNMNELENAKENESVLLKVGLLGSTRTLLSTTEMSKTINVTIKVKSSDGNDNNSLNVSSTGNSSSNGRLPTTGVSGFYGQYAVVIVGIILLLVKKRRKEY